LPAGERAAKAVKANAKKSDRALLCHVTQLGSNVLAVLPNRGKVETRTGRDGKTRKPPNKPAITTQKQVNAFARWLKVLHEAETPADPGGRPTVAKRGKKTAAENATVAEPDGFAEKHAKSTGRSERVIRQMIRQEVWVAWRHSGLLTSSPRREVGHACLPRATTTGRALQPSGRDSLSLA
jgi:hypothetical protein